MFFSSCSFSVFPQSLSVSQTHSVTLHRTMAVWTAAARQAANMARISSPKSACTAQAASLVHWRGLAGGGDHHGPLKVNFWEDPMHPSKWKQEHFVIVSLAGWGTLLYGGYKFFTKDKKDKKDEALC